MVINLNESISSLIKKDESLKEVLYEIGFKEILNPIMLKTAAKFMTLKKGAKMRNINLDEIIKKLEERGYEVKDE